MVEKALEVARPGCNRGAATAERGAHRVRGRHAVISEPLYADRHWTSADGLRLHFRDYPAADDAGDRVPVICLHGLTRNARDFADLAEFLARTGRRVLVPEMRGRGDSEYARDAATYNVGQYVADLNALREQEGIGRYVAIGTSMGGLMTMVQAMHDPAPIAAAVLNDIGPVVDPAGLDRIMDYVGQGGSYPTWIHAARALEELHKAAYPGFDLDDWLQMAKRTMTLCGNGRIAHDYDMSIAEPLRAADGGTAAAPADLWPGFDALAQRPLMLVRGELSNLLSQATFAEMRARAPQAAAVSVPEIGHAPTLDEPCVRSALGDFMARLD